jgi:hypothetical protein
MCAVPNPLIEAMLAAADPLPYPGRTRLFAAQARELAAAGELDPVLAELREGEVFEREIGLFLAEVGGRVEAVRAYLTEPNWRLRLRALGILIRTGAIDAAAIAAQLTDAPAQVLRQVSRVLRAVAATGVADALVDQVRAEFRRCRGGASAAGLRRRHGGQAAAGRGSPARQLGCVGPASPDGRTGRGAPAAR